MATHTYQMAINTNIGGQFASNILHFSFDDSGFATTQLAAAALCTAWNAANRTRFLNIISVHTTFLSLRARAINVVGGFEGALTVAAGVVGNRAGNLGAAGLSACVLFFPIGNAKQRGRFFLPGLSEDDAIDGIFTTAFANAVATNIAGIIAPFTLTGGGAPTATPVVWSRKLLTPFTIFAASLSPMIAQIRRRQMPV